MIALGASRLPSRTAPLATSSYARHQGRAKSYLCHATRFSNSISSRIGGKRSTQHADRTALGLHAAPRKRSGYHLGGRRSARRDVSVASGAEEATALVPLGLDFLAFLGTTVIVVPLFKKLKLSPILGFLASGLLLKELGVMSSFENLSSLSQLGVLFLLFEMGLELSLSRLNALAKYAFGIGCFQMVLCVAAFSFLAYIPHDENSIGTSVLMTLSNAPFELLNIQSVKEAIVVGAAFSMSSSAFVLQILTERGELATRFGSATLGVLLFQDISIVPLLVLLPLLEGGGLDSSATPLDLITKFGPTAAMTLGGLGVLLLGGSFVLRQVFAVVAKSGNQETFVAMCLFTVAGAALLTESMGFSDTLGAFIAGFLLSETNFKTQVEADIKPFRGLLLGLFFVTTGSSIDLNLLAENWQLIAWMLAGLLSIKTVVIASLGIASGLSRNEAIHLGFTLSQGGEFAFVLLSLAESLHLLPESLNQILLITVVLSMALTPALETGGKAFADYIDDMSIRMMPPPRRVDEEQLSAVPYDENLEMKLYESPVVICGFGLQGQMLANMLESPLLGGAGGTGRPYIAFDTQADRVRVARAQGFSVFYGDGTQPEVLAAAGVKRPQSLVVTLGGRASTVNAVATLRAAYPDVPIYACGKGVQHAAQLEAAGATRITLAPTEAGVALASELMEYLGVSGDDLINLREGVNDALEVQTHKMAFSLKSLRPASSIELLVLDKELHAARVKENMARRSALEKTAV